MFTVEEVRLTVLPNLTESEQGVPSRTHKACLPIAQTSGPIHLLLLLFYFILYYIFI
jgi:hypothetical protein